MGNEEIDGEFAEYDVTCRVEGCRNANATIRMTMFVDTLTVLCGPCRAQITDVVEVFDATPD